MASARARRLALLALCIALGLFAEWAALRRGPLQAAATAHDRRPAMADFIVGLTLVACGLLAWSRRPKSRIGVLLAAAGFAWFLGTFAGSGTEAYDDFGSLFVTLHRGFLIHAVLAYPAGRVRAGLDRAVVAAGYAYAAIEPVGQNEGVTIVLGILVIALSARRYIVAAGLRRAERAPAVAAALGFGLVLAVGSSLTLAGADSRVDRVVLWAYMAVLFAITVGLTLDLLLGRWTSATVTGLVVDLGEVAEMGPLRDRLASALGDRSLIVGYWLPEEGRYVDDRGGPVELPGPASGRRVTLVGHEGQPLAALVHDPAVLDDRELVESVASGAGIAVSNVRLQAEIRRQVEELDASRRRIVEAGGAQRVRLERELREGAERRLAAVKSILAGTYGGVDAGEEFTAMLAETRQELERAQDELGELAQGIHPRALTEEGLAAALTELVSGASFPVDLRATRERFPAAIEAAAYFGCSEGLANIAKYAQASHVSIEVSRRGRGLVVAVRDDGVGGARLDAGSGLRGLADRVEALGGRLSVESRPGEGTRLLAELPVI